MKFANLHAHTSMGSMLDALMSVDQMFDKAKELGMVAAGVTDHGTLAAHFDALKASKRTGVKLVPGCEMYFVHSYDPVDTVEKRKKNERRKHLVLLAQNEKGYKNLLVANYKAFGHGDISVGRVYPRLSWDILREHSEGIVCTSACGQGIVAEKLMLGDMDGARSMVSMLAEIFPGRFFLEIQPHHLKIPVIDQELINRGLISLSKELKLPLVAAVDTHYLSKGMAKYKDMLTAFRWKCSLEEQIKENGATLDEFYMKSGDEVFAFLVEHYGEDVAAEAVGNTVRIAEEMCGDTEYLKSTGNHLPLFQVENETDHKEFEEWRQTKAPAGLDTTDAFMRFRCFKSFLKRFENMPQEEQMKRWERVKYEVRILEKNKFSSYMLVVADFINWAKKNGILVGVGRGSVGGCMCAFLLGIHGVDPFDYGLMFERFQNVEKKSLPDIDTDFTSAGRDVVEEYVRGKYGHDRCAQVSNINTYTPKNTISDLARSMRISDDQEGGRNYFQLAMAIKDSIPEKDEKDQKITTLEQALKLSPKFKEFTAQYPELMEYANVFIGLEKEYSTHAAGMVVSDIPLVEFAPLRIDKDGKIAVQLEKNRCEELGLVKMDFLAISTLDIIDEAFKNIKRLGENGPTTMEKVPLNDPETYAMISKGHTRCVFQLGKTGMMAALCKQIKPKNIIDLAIINALGRPSSKLIDKETNRSERDEFVGRRCGDIKVSYLHPSLQCLQETNGLCIMEEQLMGVAKNVAGWDLNKADGLRKLTKLKEKGKDLAIKLEKEFVEGAIQTHGMTQELAQEVWDKVIGKFSGYGFNKTMDKCTLIVTGTGIKMLQDCVVDDIVFVDNCGKIETTQVIAVHDHGIVPLWEVEFDNGTVETCTLDHKWVTRKGKLPLWEILERDEGVLQMDVSRMQHLFSNKKGNVCAQENLFGTPQICEKRFIGNAHQEISLWVGNTNDQCGGERAQKKLSCLSTDSKNNTQENQEFIKQIGIYAEKGFRSCKENFRKTRNSTTACGAACNMEKGKPRGFSGDTNESVFLTKKVENGKLVGTDFETNRFPKECEIPLWQSPQTSGFSEQKTEDSCGSGWTLAFFSGTWRRGSTTDCDEGSHTKCGNITSTQMETRSHIYGELQELWRNRFKREVETFRGCHIKQNTYDVQNNLYRKIIRIKYVGKRPGCDLEVAHTEHNFLLASGLFTSNSHAVFYSINGYYTAYLKCHHPAAFMAAKLKIETGSNSITSDDEIDAARQECRRLGIKIIPPDVNRSGTAYDVVDSKTIIMGLAAIKGLGEKAAQEIVSKQSYTSFADFLYRTEARTVNKSKLEAMAKAGCFDSLGIPRKFAFEAGKDARERLKRVVAKRQKDGYDVETAIGEFSLGTSDEWDRKTMLTNEAEVLGQCLSGTINEIYDGFFTGIGTTPLVRLKALPNRYDIVVEVLVKTATREFTIKKEGRNKGRKMIKYNVEDIEGTVTELTVWPDQYEMAKRRLGEGVPIRAQCQVSDFNGQKTLMLMKFQEIYGEKKKNEGNQEDWGVET